MYYNTDVFFIFWNLGDAKKITKAREGSIFTYDVQNFNVLWDNSSSMHHSFWICFL